MFKWYRSRRNRMTSEVAVSGNLHWRVTRQRGRIIGIERWAASEHHDPVYTYTCWKF